MTKPCKHEQMDAHCRICLLAETDNRYRTLWGLPTLSTNPILEGHYARLRQVQSRPRKDTIHIAMTSLGIGDSLILLTVTEGIRRAYPATKLVLGLPEASIAWARYFPSAYSTLAVNYTLAYDQDTYYPYDSYAVELEEQGRLPRSKYYSLWCGLYDSTPIIPECIISREDMGWANQYAGSILLFPRSHWKPRNWMIHNWYSLEDRLISSGKKVLQVDCKRNDPAPLKLRSPAIVGETPGRILALIKVSRAVIALDSAASHVGGLLGVPTLCLQGPTGKGVFSTYPSVRCIESDLMCRGCYWRGNYYQGSICDTVCASLQQITPGQVVAALEEVLAPARSEKKCCGGAKVRNTRALATHQG